VVEIGKRELLRSVEMRNWRCVRGERPILEIGGLFVPNYKFKSSKLPNRSPTLQDTLKLVHNFMNVLKMSLTPLNITHISSSKNMVETKLRINRLI
jgi:hypothetical protein